MWWLKAVLMVTSGWQPSWCLTVWTTIHGFTSWTSTETKRFDFSSLNTYSYASLIYSKYMMFPYYCYQFYEKLLWSNWTIIYFVSYRTTLQSQDPHFRPYWHCVSDNILVIYTCREHMYLNKQLFVIIVSVIATVSYIISIRHTQCSNVLMYNRSSVMLIQAM